MNLTPTFVAPFSGRSLRIGVAALLMAQSLIVPADRASAADLLNRREGVVLYRMKANASPAQIDAFNRLLAQQGANRPMAVSANRSIQAVSIPRATSEEQL